MVVEEETDDDYEFSREGELRLAVELGSGNHFSTGLGHTATEKQCR